jgi:SPP1 gp7 family putative phage head morphogenesis protein
VELYTAGIAAYNAAILKELLPLVKKEFEHRSIKDVVRQDSFNVKSWVELAREVVAKMPISWLDLVSGKTLQSTAKNFELNFPAIDLIHDPSAESAASHWIEQNTRLIKTLPKIMVDRIENVFKDESHKGLRIEEISDAIVKVQATTRNHANFIARDQTSKLVSSVEKARCLHLGFEEYYWRTSLDVRVREAHVKLEGKVFTFLQGNNGIHPGMPYNCRCTREPILPD